MEQYGQPLQSFREYCKNLSSNSSNNNISIFITDDGTIYSLHMDYNKKDNTIEFSNICWQDEGLNDGYHNVCHSESNDKMIYDMKIDLITQDVYLDDKYGDCSGRYLGKRLYTFFKETPKCCQDFLKKIS